MGVRSLLVSLGGGEGDPGLTGEVQGKVFLYVSLPLYSNESPTGKVTGVHFSV